MNMRLLKMRLRQANTCGWHSGTRSNGLECGNATEEVKRKNATITGSLPGSFFYVQNRKTATIQELRPSEICDHSEECDRHLQKRNQYISKNATRNPHSGRIASPAVNITAGSGSQPRNRAWALFPFRKIATLQPSCNREIETRREKTQP